jgi:hypothetical protein
LEYSLNLEENVSIHLIDIQGKTKKILIDNQKQKAGIHQQKIGLTEEFPQGIYFIIISIEGRQYSVELIK